MYLALRELKRSKLRYGLIGVIMILLSFLVLVISGLANGLSHDNASFIQTMDAKSFVLSKDAEGKMLRSQIDLNNEDVKKEITKDQGAVPFRIQMSTYLKGDSSKKVDVALVSSKRDSIIEPKITEGRKYTNNKNEAVADESIKSKGVELGDVITEPITKHKFKIVGFTKDKMFSHAPVVFVNESVWDKISQPNQKNYNAIVMEKDTNIDGYKIAEKSEVLKGIPGYKEEQGTLTMIIGFLLVIAALLIAVFFYVLTLQKTQQIGVLKAIGTTNKYLTFSLVIQSLLLTVISIALSIVLVIGLQSILPAAMPFSLPTTTIITYSAVFVVISVVGTLISLYQVLKVDALDAIGGGGQ
ncbi:ABC transporter permease [Bacillus cereus]|uniref:Putative hemin transport system permease protein HrtB n=1 Tax=Bacillus cereus TaxID=1396 RepID=A0A164NYR1_BACCE|nr:ABC transporter permease [Bacillus cereus]KZD66003.1 Heme efflux system permease HrtB [Bacillus cereus]